MVVHWINIGMLMGSSLGEPKSNFIFANFSVGLNVKSWRNPRWIGSLEVAEK